MLSVLFTICMIWFVGKFFIFGLKASWGIMKLLCTVIFFPVILIGMHGRWINVYSFSAIDHWWNYRTCNITFIKSQEVFLWDMILKKEKREAIEAGRKSLKQS
ncbi:MAG: hypothetical protein ACLTEE_04830 [Anaerobutyricum hallii]